MQTPGKLGVDLGQRAGETFGEHAELKCVQTPGKLDKTQGKVRILRPSSETALSAPVGLVGTGTYPSITPHACLVACILL